MAHGRGMPSRQAVRSVKQGWRTPRFPRSAITALLLSMALAGTFGGLAQAQQPFPAKPVRLVIPYPAGGTTDMLGRIVGQRLSDLWKQPVLADNRPGAGGSIGAALVAKSPPDGYSLVLGNSASHGAYELLNPANTPYHSIRDFSPISLLAMSKLALVVRPDLPAQSVKELVALAKSQPGKLNYGSPSIGSSPHLALELFKMVTGTDIVHIPYAGAAPARTALLAGSLDLYAGGVTAMTDMARSGKVRVLGVFSDKRAQEAPDVPTLAELGVPAEMDTWYGLLGPAGMPADIVAKINADTRRGVDGEEIRVQLAKLDFERATGTADSFAALLVREREKMAKIIRDAKIKAE
jgi:tripartite-type tricarboxylate transporter receptor subunit TctC